MTGHGNRSGNFYKVKDMKVAAKETELLRNIVESLFEVGSEIRAFVPIGSFDCLPDIAMDIDIVVITESDLPVDLPWDAVSNLPKPWVALNKVRH